MSDPVVIVDPAGTEHEFPSGFDPKKAGLIVSRAYGDEQAAAAQKKAEAGSTFGSQMTPSNLLHDAGTVAGAGWDVLKTLAKEGWKNPLGINPPERQLTDEQIDQIGKGGLTGAVRDAGQNLGRLRTVPSQVAQAVTSNPIDTLQRAGVTPDMAAHAGGTVAALGAVGATLPNAGQLTTSTGNLITRGGQAMNPAITKTLGEGVGALAEAGLGGGSGSPTMGGLGRVFAGSKIGGAIGEAIPAMTRGTGRLITKAGQFMGSATGTPAGLTPPAPVVRPNTLMRADTLENILNEVRQQGTSPTTVSGAPTDVPPVGAGRTEEGAVSSGRPAVTPARYQEMQDLEKRAAVAAPPVVAETEAPLPTQAVRDQTAARPVADEAEAAGVPEEPEATAGESTIPSREQMTPDELSRAREGARDSPDRQPGETLEDYRLRTRSRVTGEQSADPSIIPSRRSAGIDDTIESMYARNATDQEFRDYLAKSKNHPNNGQIAAKIESKAHSWKRASPLAHVVAGVAAGGAALRSALVNQLQGDQKDQEQD